MVGDISDTSYVSYVDIHSGLYASVCGVGLLWVSWVVDVYDVPSLIPCFTHCRLLLVWFITSCFKCSLGALVHVAIASPLLAPVSTVGKLRLVVVAVQGAPQFETKFVVRVSFPSCPDNHSSPALAVVGLAFGFAIPTPTSLGP